MVRDNIRCVHLDPESNDQARKTSDAPKVLSPHDYRHNPPEPEHLFSASPPPALISNPLVPQTHAPSPTLGLSAGAVRARKICHLDVQLPRLATRSSTRSPTAVLALMPDHSAIPKASAAPSGIGVIGGRWGTRRTHPSPGSSHWYR